jgi:uncharacterized membrane protein
MNLNLKLFISSAIILLLIDSIYLWGFSTYFSKLIKTIQKQPLVMNYLGVVICYILLIIGLNYFVLQNNSLKTKDKIKNAFILGIVIYGVYDSTNHAIFNKWDLKTLLLDTIWGGILLSLTTYISLQLNN